MRIFVFLGAPGSGKGTQAKRLAESQGFKHFSTGDMLRAAIAAGSEVGLRAKTFIDKGDLVPDDVMIDLIQQALAELPSSAKVILDGFPRTVAQAEALDASKTTTVSKALMFEIPESMLLKRLTGRRICRKCGASYHTEFFPIAPGAPCKQCGSTDIYQRADDSAEVVGHRLEVFKKQNQGLLDYYGQAKKLQKLDANKPVDLIQRSLVDQMS